MKCNGVKVILGILVVAIASFIATGSDAVQLKSIDIKATCKKHEFYAGTEFIKDYSGKLAYVEGGEIGKAFLITNSSHAKTNEVILWYAEDTKDPIVKFLKNAINKHVDVKGRFATIGGHGEYELDCTKPTKITVVDIKPALVLPSNGSTFVYPGDFFEGFQGVLAYQKDDESDDYAFVLNNMTQNDKITHVYIAQRDEQNGLWNVKQKELNTLKKLIGKKIKADGIFRHLVGGYAWRDESKTMRLITDE